MQNQLPLSSHGLAHYPIPKAIPLFVSTAIHVGQIWANGACEELAEHMGGILTHTTQASTSDQTFFKLKSSSIGVLFPMVTVQAMGR